jgi:hypothetical protein
MKRWGLLVMAAVFVWLLVRGRTKAPTDIVVPQHVAQPDITPHRPTPSAPRGPSPPILAPNPTPSPSPQSDTYWQQRAHDYRERLINLKPERVGEIEAVAPRLHLSPEVVQKLSRWSDVATDLTASELAKVETRSEWERAMERGGAISASHQKAEIKVLGGLDTWNRYYRLQGASMTGHLDDVDDNGDWKIRGPYPDKPIGNPDRSRPPRSPSDTSQFDHYFAD